MSGKIVSWGTDTEEEDPELDLTLTGCGWSSVKSSDMSGRLAACTSAARDCGLLPTPGEKVPAGCNASVGEFLGAYSRSALSARDGVAVVDSRYVPCACVNKIT